MSKVLERKLAAGAPAEATEAAQIVRQVNEAISKTRELSRGMLPVTSGANGLIAALERIAGEAQARFGIPCSVICEQPLHLDDDRIATHLYRIAQEALNNAIKHASAKHIEIMLRGSRGEFAIEIRDDGIGLQHEPGKGDGIGLRIMKHRARTIGATLDVRSGPESGTIVTCHLGAPERTPSGQSEQ